VISPSRIQPETRQWVQRVQGRMRAGRPRAAARLFWEGYRNGLIPPHHRTAQWISQEMGKKTLAGLTAVFAHSPCYYCRKGLVSCAACQGTGRLNQDEVCEQCLGLGLSNCKCCAATGWLPLTDLPGALRLPVTVQRCQRAVTHIKELIVPVFSVASAGRAPPFKTYAQLLLKLNRYCGVLENALLATAEPVDEQADTKATCGRIVTLCTQVAVAAQEKREQILYGLARAASAKVHQERTPAGSRLLAVRKTDFYRTLAKSNPACIGTDWEHPFLRRAVTAMVKR